MLLVVVVMASNKVCIVIIQFGTSVHREKCTGKVPTTKETLYGVMNIIDFLR